MYCPRLRTGNVFHCAFSKRSVRVLGVLHSGARLCLLISVPTPALSFKANHGEAALMIVAG